MKRKYYDKNGKMVGFSRSGKDVEKEDAATSSITLYALFYAPVILASIILMAALTKWGVHGLFSIIIGGMAGILSIFVMQKFTIIRQIYIIAISIFFSALAFKKISSSYDNIWASGAAISTLLFFILFLNFCHFGGRMHSNNANASD
ncbi:hypothetical protein [Novosphingobium sp.]|uniref:hypothetical protein n=1 Tax=Novosphingobium sp. TaxID=1874826 RepID=UPI002FD92F3D